MLISCDFIHRVKYLVEFKKKPLFIMKKYYIILRGKKNNKNNIQRFIKIPVAVMSFTHIHAFI